MERACFYLRIFPGTEAEYERRHNEIWPELVTEIRESGLLNMSGFRRGTDVWYYVEAEPDAKTAFAVQGPKPANQRWNRYFRDVIAQITTPSGKTTSVRLMPAGEDAWGLFTGTFAPTEPGEHHVHPVEAIPRQHPEIRIPKFLGRLRQLRGHHDPHPAH